MIRPPDSPSSEGKPPSPRPVPPRASRSGRILVVDDRPDKLVTMEAALAPLGREIVLARSGSDALRCLLEHDFAVILLDMNMPGMDGFETAQRIRQRRRNSDTPIMFITAYGDDMHTLQGYALGAVDFILAPVVPEVLSSKVAVFLELYERTGEVREQATELLARTRQLQELARASLKIHAAPSVDEALQLAADSARHVIGSRQAWAFIAAGQAGFKQAALLGSPGGRAAVLGDLTAELALREIALGETKCAPFDQTVLAGCLGPSAAVHWPGLVAPLIGRKGDIIGALLVAGKRRREFSSEDESLLVQLAQMAATAVENTLFAEAREANRLKDEFLATLSHELRTPLSSILGWAQLLRTRMLDETETAEALEIIERNAQMQCKLIEELLDVSRIVTGKMQLNMRPLELRNIVEAAVGVVLPAAHGKNVRIDARLAESGTVHGDADRLQQVFWNLLSNAVKFTPAQGQIEICSRVENGQAEVAVRDSGEGIAPEFLPHIFDRFRQADSSTSRRHGGLGIGLAIVRHVVELHGGTVRAESEGRGKGTTIIVNLPLARPQASDQGAEETKEPGGVADRQQAETGQSRGDEISGEFSTQTADQQLTQARAG